MLEVITWIIVVLLIAVFIAATVIRFHSKPKETEYERMKNIFMGKVWAKSRLLTKTEKIFYDQLVRYLMNSGYAIFSQVRLADVVEIGNAWNDFYYFLIK